MSKLNLFSTCAVYDSVVGKWVEHFFINQEEVDPEEYFYRLEKEEGMQDKELEEQIKMEEYFRESSVSPDEMNCDCEQGYECMYDFLCDLTDDVKQCIDDVKDGDDEIDEICDVVEKLVSIYAEKVNNVNCESCIEIHLIDFLDDFLKYYASKEKGK